MKIASTTRPVAQGELFILPPIEALPAGAVRVEPENGVVIVGHSETGHHHVMDADIVEMYRLPDDILKCFIVVKEATTLVHLREHDTHEPIMFEPSIRPVRRQREFVPEGWRRAAD